ncbi:MAG: vanadium-dependent haloperoxidase [Saprospiraceae bacterium]|nr:vanadium-dependent haloperoxidase [Saprospiraceae bacterium]
MKSLMNKLLISFSFVLLTFASCNKSEVVEEGNQLLKSQDSEVYHEWNNVFMEVERYASFFRPGPAPRALAYLGLSAYEACLGGMPEYQSLRYRLGINDLPEVQKNLYWPAVINASYGYLMNKFFENVKFKDKSGNDLDHRQFMNLIKNKEVELRSIYRKYAVETILINSEAYGKEVAAAIWRFAITDPIGHNAHLNPYPDPVNAQGCEWVPTDPLTVTDRALYPQWGKVRRFAINQSDMDALVAPFPCSADTGSIYYLHAKECYILSNLARNEPNGDLEHMAEFWSDDRVGWTFSPPTRLVAIADQIVENETMDLEKTCVLYAQLGIALNEAAVISWYNKYKYNVERPISYIHRVIDPNWTVPWLGFTPPFPGYPSGHSTFGFAGVAVLEAFVGGSYPFTDNCHANRTDFLGRARSFNTLRDLANENAYSRLPLGVHFRMDYDSGNFCGTLAARKVLELPWKK